MTLSAVPAPAALRASEVTSFDAARYGAKVDWTKSCVLIDGRPVVIVSAEFHYFRVPDRERWRPILTDIKGAGFNTVRLYFHWGYHSPAEGVYNFRGNRDINYLLELCTELHLFVITAPGPYICAEVQAGGYPIWLVAKRELRIRHLRFAPIGLVKKWDQQFHNYCAHYMRTIVPMLAKHERTNTPNGCIVSMQIENELRQPMPIGIGGLDDEIRLLCDIARESGSTVPFFHNDDSPIGSWSKGKALRSVSRGGMRAGRPMYRTDMYGFDLYFTFPPGDKSGDASSMQVGMIELCGVSACLNCFGIGGAGVGGSDKECISCLYHRGVHHAPPPALGWAATSQMTSAVDKLESKLQKIGGSAHLGPVVIAETQVGWINQWGRMRSYDDVYNFFGMHFSSTLQVSLMAQGVTVANHYMAYGGTNHGSLGDTEVYSSYDYSAFIREYGMLSDRGRKMRQVMLFARSFASQGFANTKPFTDGSARLSHARARIKATVSSLLLGVREAVRDDELDDGGADGITEAGFTQRPLYAYLRNLAGSPMRFSLIVDEYVLPCALPHCDAMVVPLYHLLETGGLAVLACSVPVVCRASYAGSELWVLRTRPKEIGRLVLNVLATNSDRRHSLRANWALLPAKPQAGAPCTHGTVAASDLDAGAATPLVSTPLDELPLGQFGAFSGTGTPIALRASTEAAGLCYSMVFSGQATTVVSISCGESASPVLRLLCLTEQNADTFTADLGGEDPFLAPKSHELSSPFAAAWGANSLAFTPAGKLEVGYDQNQSSISSTFIVRSGDTTNPPEQFVAGPQPVCAILPNVFVHEVAEGIMKTTLCHGVADGDPLSPNFEIPTDGWSRRVVDWREDVMWKEISYENRDPLDHHMTSGHVAYRLRFRCTARRVGLVINVRHSAVVWCDGVAVGGQICISHNAASAGAMHAVDLHRAGKKRYDLTKALRALGPETSGFHEVIILVLSFGQSRSPFLLNDVRNKRGLLSARLSRRAGIRGVRWDIGGVTVSRLDDAYGSSGLPLENEMNDCTYDAGMEASTGTQVTANDGLVYYRSSFRVPSNSVIGGIAKYPLRIQIRSGAGTVAMIWVNTLLIGRYVEKAGPQSDFYVPEGLIKLSKGNSLVIAVYGAVDTSFSVHILPWVVASGTGNLLEERGEVFALRLASLEVASSKQK